MPVAADHLFIVTGGPGSGKTSMPEALHLGGVPYLPEAGRAIIREQQAIGGTALPWADRAAFALAMLDRDVRSFRAARARPGPLLCDRGTGDVIGYMTLCGLPVPARVRRAALSFRYNRNIFFAPHRPVIYVRDGERRQHAAEAEATGRVMAATYRALGYALVMLPKASVAERAAFVRARLNAA